MCPIGHPLRPRKLDAVGSGAWDSVRRKLWDNSFAEPLVDADKLIGSFPRGNDVVPLALRIPARSRLYLHAFRNRCRTAPKRRAGARTLVRVIAGFCGRFFAGFHFVWRLSERYW